MLTLYITPVIYVYMDRITHGRTRRRSPAALLAQPAPRAN